VNLEIIEDSGTVTELLEPGGPVTPEEGESFVSLCRELFQSHPSVVLAISGSIPVGLPSEFYCSLVDAAHERSHTVLVDTSGAALEQVLCAQPDLVKVNRNEAEAVLGRKLNDMNDTVRAASQLQASGARSVAISCGADGLVALMDGETEPLLARSSAIDTRSTVGCGDATLAGFAAAYSRKLGTRDTVRLAVACGTANCLAVGPGLIEAARVEEFVHCVQVMSLGVTRVSGGDHVY
jgi:1-phosphofructokinase family hexose kinase